MFSPDTVSAAIVISAACLVVLTALALLGAVALWVVINDQYRAK